MEFQRAGISDSENSWMISVAPDAPMVPSEEDIYDSMSEYMLEELKPLFPNLESFKLDVIDVMEDGGTPVSVEVPPPVAESSLGASSKPKSTKAKKKVRVVAKQEKVQGKSGKRRGRPPKETASKTIGTAKKKQIRTPRNYVPEEEKDEEYLKRRAVNNQAARRSRAKKKLMDAVHGDSWVDFFDATEMTEAQRAVLEGIRTRVGLLMCEIWDLAVEHARAKYQKPIE